MLQFLSRLFHRPLTDPRVRLRINWGDVRRSVRVVRALP